MTRAVLNILSRYAPGPNTAGALAEANSWVLWRIAGTSGVDGETALRGWNKGKTDVDSACRIAEMCDDPKALTVMLKDKRIQVRRSVLRNPKCSWNDLAHKASWYHGRPGGEHSNEVRRDARAALETALHRESFAVVLGWLHTGVPSVAFEVAGRHPNISDDELLSFAHTKWVTDNGDGADACRIASSGDLSKFSDATLRSIASVDGQSGNPPGDGRSLRNVVSFCAREGRETLARQLLLEPEFSQWQNTSYDALCFAAGMSADFYTLLFNLRAGSGGSNNNVLVANPGAPWRLWRNQTMRDPLIHAFGRALRELWGDNATVWMFASQLAESASGATLGELVDAVAAIYPPDHPTDYPAS